MALTTCNEYGGAVKVIACIEDPIVIKKILSYFIRQKSGQRKIYMILFLDLKAPMMLFLSGFIRYLIKIVPHFLKSIRRSISSFLTFLNHYPN